MPKRKFLPVLLGTTQSVKPAVLKSFRENQTTIHAAALEAAGAMQKANEALSRLSINLYRYRREPDEAFIRWACAWVQREVKRLAYIERIFTEFPKLVFAAASRSVGMSFVQDYALEPCDHEADLYVYLMEKPKKIDKMLLAGTAKDSTRLYRLVNSRTRGLKTKMNRRHAAIRNRYKDGDCLYVDQVVRPEEIRATKISRKQLKELGCA